MEMRAEISSTFQIYLQMRAHNETKLDIVLNFQRKTFVLFIWSKWNALRGKLDFTA